MKNFYELLEVPPTAPADEIKRAFRVQIARYHPDKVQHLGQEFQAMAADRAAELTEAYRVLSDAVRREEYDQLLQNGEPAATQRPTPDRTASATAPAPPRPAPAPADPQPPQGASRQFSRERNARDAFVRRAVVGKLRQAITSVMGAVDESELRGFDVVAVPRTGLFARSKGPRLLARFVPCVDRDAVNETWGWAARWNVPAKDEICVLLMGSAMAPAGELADAIARQRRLSAKGPKVTVIPVDARDWQAHVPTDAPPSAKRLLALLRQGG